MSVCLFVRLFVFLFVCRLPVSLTVCLFLLCLLHHYLCQIDFQSVDQGEISLLFLIERFDSIMSYLLLPSFRGPKEDWYSQLGHPHKIKNLLTYLFTYLLEGYTNLMQINAAEIYKNNQRTNAPANAHLISLPSKAQNIQNLENIW